VTNEGHTLRVHSITQIAAGEQISIAYLDGGDPGEFHCQTDISQFKTDISQSKTDISQFKTDISQFKTDISQFKTDISQFKTDISQSKTDISQCVLVHTVRRTPQGGVCGYIDTHPCQNPFGIHTYGISQSKTDISQSQADILQSTTDISQSQTDISQSLSSQFGAD
jgi:hypothetical protein